MEEEQLVADAKANPEKFALLYDKYLTPVYRYFLIRTGHKETAEDLSSQTFLKAVEAFPKYEMRAPFGAWLFTIAHNLLMTCYRKLPPLPLDYAEQMAASGNIAEDLDNKLMREKLAGLIAGLPERDKQIVLLRTASDLSFEQISEVLNISSGAARTAYHRAVQKLTA